MTHNNPKLQTSQETLNNLMDKWWYVHKKESCIANSYCYTQTDKAHKHWTEQARI